jgi:hypothetical protein
MDFSIIARMKHIAGIKTDKDLAELIDLSPADFSNRKKRDTLLPLIIDWAIHEKVDLNWLLTGDGNQTLDSVDADSLNPVDSYSFRIKSLEKEVESLKEQMASLVDLHEGDHAREGHK